MIQVDHDGQSGQHEQQGDHPEILIVPFIIVIGADQSEDEGEQVIFIISLVIHNGGRLVGLGSQSCLVNELDPADPVSFGQFPVSLNIILPSGKAIRMDRITSLATSLGAGRVARRALQCCQEHPVHGATVSAAKKP